MFNINFCKHVKLRFESEYKRVARICARERKKKAADEAKRKLLVQITPSSTGEVVPQTFTLS